MFLAAKLHPNAVIPSRANPCDAGYDLTACEESTIPAHGWCLVPTGISIQIPGDCYARVAPRSGLSTKGLTVGAGVVDSGYRGEVKVLLFNHNVNDYHVKAGDRVAQMILERIYTPSEWKEVTVEELSTSHRGTAGFGSTGQ